MSRPRINYVGKQFGRLSVIEDSGKMVLCRCECGKTKLINKYNLSRGKTISCGCYREEVGAEMAERNFKDNIEIMRSRHINVGRIIRNKPMKNSKTGIVGVCYDEKRSKYRAYLCAGRHNRYLGMYPSVEEAKAARARAEEVFFAPIVEEYGV